MLESLLYAFISVGIVSLISLVGVLTFAISGNFLRRILILLVSFAAGALLGDVFIHLLPEVVKEFVEHFKCHQDLSSQSPSNSQGDAKEQLKALMLYWDAEFFSKK